MPEAERPPPRTRGIDAALAALLTLAAACASTPPQPSEGPLELADRLFDERRYVESAAAYSDWLAGGPDQPAVDHALFRLALIHLSAAGEAHDPGTARSLLRQLVREHPESPYRPAVEAILAWREDLERVRGQLEELKRIDLREEPRAPPR